MVTSPKGSDPRKTTLARASSIYIKYRTVLSSERAPNKNKTVIVKQ
jgi:hypothetical protein